MTLGGKVIPLIFSTSMIVRMRTQFYCPSIASFPTVLSLPPLHKNKVLCHYFYCLPLVEKIHTIQLVINTITAATAKSLQSCLTLCDPIDSSPPGSLVPGILQARTLEWVAISSSKLITTLILFFIAVPVKSELAVEILEKGQVRFWMQAEKLSPNAKVNYIFNEKEIFEGPVGFIFRFLNILL